MANILNIDEDLYYRQIYVLGKKAMHELMNAHVLISGLNGVGLEIAKNIILCGVQSVHLQDDQNITHTDLSSQYYFTENDIGQNRAKIAYLKLADLNKYVQVTYSSQPLHESFNTLNNIDVILLTDVLHDEQIMIGDYCHKNHIKFIIANTRGLFGQIFCDFGDNFEVSVVDGEKPQTYIVTNISHDEKGTVSIIEDSRSNLSDGSYVTFSGVTGMTEVNEKEFRITLSKNRWEFSIGDTSHFSLYENGGTVIEVKKPEIIHFKSFADAIIKPDLLICDFGKMTMPAHLHIAFQAFSAYKQKYNTDPEPWNDIDAEKFYILTCEINDKMIENSIPNDELNKDWMKLFSKTCTGNLCPIQSIIGSITAQEMIKAITKKFMPIKQFLYFDAIECLGDHDKLLSNFVSPSNSQEIIFGKDFQQQLGQLKLFVVGCGAIGCEILKNFSMMNIGCIEQNGTIFIADTNSIKRSDLNQNFQFRSSDIGKMKSNVIAKRMKEINPNINIQTFIDSVKITNHHIYDERFFEQLDGIVVAVKNTEARKFIDQCCVYYRKPAITLDTLSLKANVQIVVPFLTESYYSTEDSPELSVPLDTIKHFPNRIEHAIQWAENNFREIFIAIPEQAQKYLLNENHPKTFVDCIKWARNQFDELFHNNIVRLLFHFPLDLVTHSGERFWTKHRICPHALQFNSSDPIHIDFILAASNLIAYVYAIPQVTDRKQIIEEINRIQISQYDYKPDSIDLIEYNHIQIQTHDLNIHDDSNFHLDYITITSHLRAQNYDFGHVDRNEVKRIVGKMTPTIITTTSLVAGLASLEIYKLIQRHTNIEYFKNSFVNLGLSCIMLYEPTPMKREKYLEYEYTLWDRFEVQGDMTLEEFIDYIKRQYQLFPIILHVREYVIYAQYLLNQKERSNDMKRKLLDIYERNTKTIIPSNVSSLMIQMTCEDLQGNDIKDVPYVKYTFR